MLKIALSLGGILLFWGGGFVLFCIYVSHLSPPDFCEEADGIVVLTGGRGRVQAGLKLLEMKCGKKLLISGVSSEKEGFISPHSDLSNITFGYNAQDTIGNAKETAAWAYANNYKTLIVVTSNYHLARSLMELQAVSPQIKYTSYPIVPKSKWGFYLIFQEYNKFIYSFFRLKFFMYLK